MTDREAFKAWFQLAPHRRKYTPDHSAYLAAEEAWHAALASERAKHAEPAGKWKCPTHGDNCPGYAAPPAVQEEPKYPDRCGGVLHKEKP